MKSPKKNGIGEVVTEYGTRVMKVIKKGLLGRSLFDFYGDIKAQAFKTKESSSVPSTPADGKGGVIYTKSADGKLYYKSNEVSEVELSSSGATLTTEQVQDIVGAMFSGNTETNITVTYQDADGTIDLEATDTNTTYSEATGSAEGLMSIAHHDKLDGIESNADVTDTANVTAAGALMDSELTDLAGVKSLDTSTLATLAGTQTFTGAKTFEEKVTLDGNRTVTPGADGIALHIDAQDITDGNTSASGTAVTYNHITFENPRLFATNASVTTTDASTVFIKGQPIASTNQTITKAWALRIAGGNSYFGGNITVAGNEIKDDDGTTCITFDSSGNTTIAGTTSGTFSGNLTGNASGSSGSCTGNAATATALTSGDKTIDGDLTIDGNNITNNASAANFNIASSRILELQHAGSYDIQLGNSTNTDVLKVQGDSEVVTVNGKLDVTGNVLPGITYVKILPSDFVPDDVGRPAMIDDTGSDRWLESHGTAKLFAYVDIPVGFKATHVDIYGSATSAVTVYEADVNSKTVTSKGTGNIGTQINITDVNSDATNYILIELAQASGEEVYGGKLTIAKI
jgi:hypothetical protein